MGVNFLLKGLRKYSVICDTCKEEYIFNFPNKIKLRDHLRAMDWRWKDLGILGIVECTCPECMKQEKGDE